MKEIGREAFADSNVKSFVFSPESKLKRIGNQAFQKCAVETICIPSSVEIIENFAFEDCSQLMCVLFECDSKLKRVSSNAFQGCSKVHPIEYPPSVEFEVDKDPWS